MGVLFDYFSAASDEEAALVFDWMGGPGCPPAGQQAKDLVDTKIEAHVQMGTLEALLTGRSYEEITQRPRHARDIRPEPGSHAEHGVMTITVEFATALAAASDEQLASVAESWVRTEEFWNDADLAVLDEILHELRGLAQRAGRERRRLYCWWSL